MLKKSHHHHGAKSTSLFDIRLKNLDHDVLVLKGNEHEAGSVLLSGNIVLSVNEPISIKKISLRLYSTLRLKADLTSPSSAAAGSSRKLLTFTKQVYEYSWDPNEFSQYIDHIHEGDHEGAANHPHPLQKNHSTTSLKGLRSRSALSLTHLASSNSSTNLATSASNHTLVQGNYEIPFSAILPGNMPESIEGLPGCSLIYRLEATIDRGKFHSSMATRKHIRVVRTLTTDAVELTETIAVDNTWPKKVEYSLSCPTRALAVGSRTPISMMLIPLAKGLGLGDIKIQLIEFYSYMGNVPPMHSAERVIASKKISEKNSNGFELEFDKWEIETFLKIPASLSKCCQDIDAQHVKVRHKLKFNIGLINPDGHVSELRASLPVQLFISPFVTISSRHDAELSEDDGTTEEDVLFTSDSYDQLNNLEGQPNNNGHSSNGSHTSLTGLVAPPLYERHIYDRLWNDVSPIETPITSGASTPRSRPDAYGQFSMQPLDSSALSENLRQLSLQRQAQETNQQQPRSATFDLDDDEDHHPEHTTSHHASELRTRSPGLARNHSFLRDHTMTPPVHLSRVNSSASMLNSNEMSKVPSYSQAMKSDRNDDFSPAYEPPSPNLPINLHEVNRNLANHAQGRPTNSRGLSSLTASRGSSQGSSPSTSRNVSSSNLRDLLSSRKSSNNLSAFPAPIPQRTPNALSVPGGSNNNNGGPSAPHSLSTSPTGTQIRQPSPSTEQSVGRLSSSASDRSALMPNRTSSSLNLQNLNLFSKKKDKK
ncbi:uncharacterized protein LODBEIA_P43960 [Lodderomyces beijingensis]|uniref:Arrestin C-terminal-like domain-containing protein n=1 Tax=Lodderomyces beijingensis TaxID=1775926 RepID=A0ABP0ZV10_9ASCO